jgi:hypothetical protein
VKRLFDDDDRYSHECPAILTLVRATLDPMVKQIAEAGYSLRDLELLIVREAGDLCSQLILRRLVDQNRAKYPRVKFSEPTVDVLKDRLGLTKHRKGKGK